uniref:DUF3267 domain-containing protein n=1 Tax=Fulvivirga sp. TaxID=1931237 RepID=UPI00404AF07B
MDIAPESLTENNYTLLDKLDHKELIPFVQLYMNKRTVSSVIYYVVNSIIFAATGYFFIKGYLEEHYSLLSGFSQLSLGVLFAFLLMPLHEFIHVVAYKSQGALHTSYDAHWRKFYFMALADKFVASRKEFQIVALAPFIFISITLITLMLFANPTWLITIFGTLLFHTAMCSGDFGLLSYFDFHKNQEIVTYDDKESGMSYFYGRPWN